MNILFKLNPATEDQAKARWESIPKDSLVNLKLSRGDVDALLISIAATLEMSRGVAAAVEALARGNNDAALSALSATSSAATSATEAAERLALHIRATTESLESDYAYLS